METLLKDISKRIKKYRLKCGYTQRELVEKSDLSLPFINLIENNHRKMTLETLIKILNALDVSLSTFFLKFLLSISAFQALFLNTFTDIFE